MRLMLCLALSLVMTACNGTGNEQIDAASRLSQRHQTSSMPMEPWLDGEGGKPKPFKAYASDTGEAQKTAHMPVFRPAIDPSIFPRQWEPKNCKDGMRPRIGVLLVHGLSDTPALMVDVGNVLAEDCRLVRSILLPGHGSLPGDLRRPTAEQWKAALRYGIESFSGEVERVHVVGFSTGAAMALDFVLNGDKDLRKTVSKLVLLSPAIDLSPSKSFFLPLVGNVMLAFDGWFPSLAWFERYEDLDSVKYESFAVNGPIQLKSVMNDIHANGAVKVEIPVFMAFAAEDTTVDAKASLKFFIDRVADSRSEVLLFAAPQTLRDEAGDFQTLIANTGKSSKKISCIQGETKDTHTCQPLSQNTTTNVNECAFGGSKESGFCIRSLTHIAIPVSPENTHYGMTGEYRNCLWHFKDGNSTEYCSCLPQKIRGDSNVCRRVMGDDLKELDKANILKKLDNASICLGENDFCKDRSRSARLSYNPHFSEMMKRIQSFLN